MRRIPNWITLCPIWSVPEHLDWLERMGAENLVVLSSMSAVVKATSPDAFERRLAKRLTDAEITLATWADRQKEKLTILRPTMIYDGTTDGNVARIVSWVRRCGWFPLCGEATGLRQPVHAADVAAVSLAALDRLPTRRCYPISGGEALPFCELVVRSCRAHSLSPRTVSLPAWAWNAAAATARVLGIARGASVGMGLRMNDDLSCDHAEAAAELNFKPRAFAPGSRRIDAMMGMRG